MTEEHEYIWSGRKNAPIHRRYYPREVCNTDAMEKRPITAAKALEYVSLGIARWCRWCGRDVG